MGGRIWVESDEDQGSIFHFTAVFGRSQASAETLRPAALEGLRVLVVDDNATNLRILQEMLESWHMTSVAVGDVASALEALSSTARERFHAVITDCQMPGVDGFSLARHIKQDRTLRDTPVIMLTSVGRPETATRARKMGLDACLDKPVKHSDLLDALSSIFGVATRRAASGSAGPTATPARRLNLLVAEDNVVNRRLVTTLMQKRGHRVEAVENGREALTAVEQHGESFDVLVMDVQMPEMGGFEATSAIRSFESTTGRRLPIVGLTAHAMAGDRERCLAAGMDGYLTKPIDVDDLIATVERFADAADGESVDAPPRVVEPRLSLSFDEPAALRHTGGDRKLLKEIVSMFLADSASLMRRIKQAVDRRDGEALRLSAHALKGPIATVGGFAGRDAAAALERLGQARQFEEASQAFAELQRQLNLLEKELVSAGLTKGKALIKKQKAKGKTSVRRRRT